MSTSPRDCPRRRRSSAWRPRSSGCCACGSCWAASSRSTDRPAAVRGLRGLGRVRQGRRHQAPGRPARPAARPGRAVRRADVRREAAPLPVAVLAGAARLGRHGGARPVLVRPGAGRAGRGLRHRRAVAAGVRRDRRVRADAGRRGHDHRQVLDAPLPGGAARRFESRANDPLRSWKLTDEDWRNREKRRQYEVGGRGDAARAPTTRTRRGTSSPATTSATPGSRSSRRCARRSRRPCRRRAGTSAIRRRDENRGPRRVAWAPMFPCADLGRRSTVACVTRSLAAAATHRVEDPGPVGFGDELGTALVRHGHRQFGVLEHVGTPLSLCISMFGFPGAHDIGTGSVSWPPRPTYLRPYDRLGMPRRS